MKKIEKLKKALRNLLIEYRSINTDGGVLVYDGEEDATTGTSVYIVDEEGNHSIPEDGEYVDEEKTIYKVENGFITEITPIQEQPEEESEEQPETPAEEPAEEETPEEQPAEEPVEEDPIDERVDDEIGTDRVEEPAAEEPAEEPVEIPVEEVEEVAEEANELVERVDALVERINALEEEIETLKAFKATVEAMSAGKPAQEKFREITIDPNRSNNKELANLQKLFN